jgi:sucrose phosphorylase
MVQDRAAPPNSAAQSAHRPAADGEQKVGAPSTLAPKPTPSGTSNDASTEERGVIFNAYPDSIGEKLSDALSLLGRPEVQGAFSGFYVLPTFFNSDLDRGFSIIDYGLNEELVSAEDLERLAELDVGLKLDLVLNHLSVASPQFRDLLEQGDGSPYRDFFIDWNEFWAEQGEATSDGMVMPREEHLVKLFSRKPGLPILHVSFPDGSRRPYWNTFYQETKYERLTVEDLAHVPGLSSEQARGVVETVNGAIDARMDPAQVDLPAAEPLRDDVLAAVERKRRYLGQMDLNARSEKVWAFYDDTLRRLSEYGAKLVRLDAFAYLHKQPGERNFFNEPGTWDYLERLRQMAENYGLTLLPEIHAEYGTRLHEKISRKGFLIYDFFFPGLVIDALDRGTSGPLRAWIQEILDRDIRTVNMLGCHDGIPVLDLRGEDAEGRRLLDDESIEALMARIIARGGRVKNLFGPDGKKIAYYQVNATFFSALGEDERGLRLARAIQMFMPGIPQVWYLDLFAGKNDYAAADKGGTGGHKEINRTTLPAEEAMRKLDEPVVRDQLALMKLRNGASAFEGALEVEETPEDRLRLTWRKDGAQATLDADLRSRAFTVTSREPGRDEEVMVFA